MRKIIFGIIIFDLVLVNVGVGYLIFKSRTNETSTVANVSYQMPGNKIEYIDKCGDECKEYINAQIAGITPVPTQKIIGGTTVVAATRTKVRSTTYVTIPGSGSSGANDWETLSGTDFYFDTHDYPGIKEVYFEANMKLFNGNGMAYVRLYDSTHGVGVQGSDVETNMQVDTLITSGKINFWSGKNLIKVQAKSLTADTSVFSSGRLRIVSEN